MENNNSKSQFMKERMTFENEIEQMQDIFQYTDKEFNELSYLIPLDNVSETYSPRLYGILQSTCGQIENMCRILCSKLELKPKCDKFPCYYEALNIDGLLVKQHAYLIKKHQVIQPFIIKSGETPDWWQNYNDTKHNLPEGLKQGNIINSIESVSALYLLHRIAFYVRFEEKPLRVLCKSNWYESWIADARDLLTRRIREIEPMGIIYSELFSPISHYNPEGAQI